MVPSRLLRVDWRDVLWNAKISLALSTWMRPTFAYWLFESKPGGRGKIAEEDSYYSYAFRRRTRASPALAVGLKEIATFSLS